MDLETTEYKSRYGRLTGIAEEQAESNVRNVFDQYRHPENRLTHALMSCLAEDRDLLAQFLRWSGVSAPPSTGLRLVEQQLPGEPQPVDDEGDTGRRGLPDGWIYSDAGWSLLIESKVSSPVDDDQLKRHLRVAERRGFTDVTLLVLSPSTFSGQLPDACRHRTWPDLYRWASQESKSRTWAITLARYMEIAEQRMVEDGYLMEGTLTMFAGIHFDADSPYSYLEGKRLLKLMIGALRADERLARTLRANLKGPGRGAITGNNEGSVWDFIPLNVGDDGSYFTKHPHLTLSIDRERVRAQVTLPNGLDAVLRRRLVAGGYEGFKAAIGAFVQKVEPELLQASGVVPYLMALQRHYPTQRAVPIRDAVLEFDPRTALAGGGGVKFQEEWMHATFAALSNRRSNIQIGVGLSFAYSPTSIVREANFVAAVAETWLATKPLLDLILSPPAPQK